MRPSSDIIDSTTRLECAYVQRLPKSLVYRHLLPPAVRLITNFEMRAATSSGYAVLHHGHLKYPVATIAHYTTHVLYYKESNYSVINSTTSSLAPFEGRQIHKPCERVASAWLDSM